MMSLEKKNKNKGWGGAPPWTPPNASTPSNKPSTASTAGTAGVSARPAAASGGYTGATGARGTAAAAAAGRGQPGHPAAVPPNANPEELLKYHADLTRYHQQAMAHHYGMMYHHHKKAAEVYLACAGEEYDFRVKRPPIPEHPLLPDDWEQQQESLEAAGSPAYLPYPPAEAAQDPAAAQSEHSGTHSPAGDEGGYLVQVEHDPKLTHEEQHWLNNQLDAAIMKEVEKQLEAEEAAGGAEGDEFIPEMICTGDEPNAEEMDRFINQIDAAQAWRAPITSASGGAVSEPEAAASAPTTTTPAAQDAS